MAIIVCLLPFVHIPANITPTSTPNPFNIWEWLANGFIVAMIFSSGVTP